MYLSVSAVWKFNRLELSAEITWEHVLLSVIGCSIMMYYWIRERGAPIDPEFGSLLNNFLPSLCLGHVISMMKEVKSYT